MCFGLVFPRVFLHQHANYLLYVQTIPGETCVKYPKGHSHSLLAHYVPFVQLELNVHTIM